MTIPTIGLSWPATNTTIPTIITYSFADERLEPCLTSLHPDYPALDAGLTAVQREAFEQAIETWEQVANVDFVLVGDSPLASLRVGSASIDGPGQILALTGLWNSGKTTTMSAVAFDQIDMENAVTDAIIPPQGELSFYRTALHELGHVLGLNHTTLSDDLMYPYPNNAITLSADDIATAVSLYGTPRATPVTSVSLTAEQIEVEKCYIAYYGRPADPGGLAYWTDQLDRNGGSLDGIITAFTHSTESQALYDGLSTTQVVTKLYSQLFGRTPELEGLQYWTTQLDAGNLTRGNIMITLLNGAQGADVDVINNKLTAAALFTNSPNSGYGIKNIDGQDVRTWLSGITTEAPYQEAVTAAINAIGLGSATGVLGLC